MPAPASPTVLTPYPVLNFSTNKQEQTVSGVVEAGVVSVFVSQRVDIPVSFNVTTREFSFNTLLQEGLNVYPIVAENAENLRSTPTVLQITLTSDDQLSIAVSQPTGVSASATKDAITIRWQGLDDEDVLGYNVRSSTKPAGGTEGYKLLNLNPLTDPLVVEEQREEILREKTREGDVETEQVKYKVHLVSSFELKDSKRQSNGGIDKQDFFYVVTSVKFDPISRQEVESVNSAEVTAKALPLTQQINEMPKSTAREVLVRLINSVFQAQPLLDVKSGTVARDLLDPSSEEFEDVYVLLDFMHKSQSLVTLLQIDDANDDGVSDTLSESEFKRALKKALHLEEDSEVQPIIDSSFTKLASTFGVERIAARPAIVDATFFTTSEPKQDLIVSVGDLVSSKVEDVPGASEVRYRVLEDKTLSFENAQAFFNFSRERWEITVPVEAETPGSIGNVAAGTITRVVSGAAGFRVENLQAAQLGEDEESNKELSERTLIQLIGVDTGSRNGYLRKALEVSGVREARVVASGDSLMFRDWDEKRKKHIGGKVDIYIQGDQFAESTDLVPYSYVLNQSRKVSIVSVPLMQFEVIDDLFNTPGNEIYNVLKVRNVTKGKDYDITGVSIISPNMVVLDATLITNLQIGLTNRDEVQVSFDRRQAQVFVLQNQPVREILDVIGDVSGNLNNNYNLYKDSDPLFEGRSNKSQDRVEIFFANSLPSTLLPPVTEETVRLLSEFRVPLSKVGVDLRTVRVFSTDETIEFIRGVDFDLETNAENTFITDIFRLISGSISDGIEVLVQYQTGENIQIRYTYNQAVQNAAIEIAEFQHITADVVVKEANRIDIDLIVTVGLKPGADKEVVDPKIRSAIQTNIANRKLGQSIFQSDIIGWIELIEGVDFVVVPLSSMVRADHTWVTAERVQLPTQQELAWEVYSPAREAIAWITKQNLHSVLDFSTGPGGGIIFQPVGRLNKLIRHVAVYQDSQPLEAQFDPAQVAHGKGRCYITEDGRLIISTLDASPPGIHLYNASYFVLGEAGAKDIIVSNMEYPSLAQLVINYQEFTSVV